MVSLPVVVSLPISIHALREESDCFVVVPSAVLVHFYPRPPRGERPLLPSAKHSAMPNFYPRPPRGERRQAVLRRVRHCHISIHALREESDMMPAAVSIWTQNFYPRPPRGERPWTGFFRRPVQGFLSTPSARRATAKTERKHPAFVSLYTSLHKLQRDAYKTNRKITPLLAQTAGIPVRSVPENHVCCRFALAGHQKISTLSWANSGCSPTCSTLVW